MSGIRRCSLFLASDRPARRFLLLVLPLISFASPPMTDRSDVRKPHVQKECALEQEGRTVVYKTSGRKRSVQLQLPAHVRLGKPVEIFCGSDRTVIVTPEYAVRTLGLTHLIEGIPQLGFLPHPAEPHYSQNTVVVPLRRLGRVQSVRLHLPSTLLLQTERGLYQLDMDAPSQPPVPVPGTVKRFFSDLYRNNREDIEFRFASGWEKAVAQGVDDILENKRTFMIALLLHEMVRNEGLLGTVWMIANTDIHTPASMTEEAFSPLRQGVVARCDRIESWYKALLKLFDIPSRVVLVQPNHTSTEIKIGDRYLLVDNSMALDEINGRRSVDQPPADGIYKIKWPNQKAVLDENLHLSVEGMRRVQKAVDEFLAAAYY